MLMKVSGATSEKIFKKYFWKTGFSIIAPKK